MGVNIIEEDGKKYVEGEEVLCIYELNILFICIRLFFYMLIFIFIFSRINTYDLFGILFLCFIFFSISYFTFLEINNLINRGFIITEKNFYTFKRTKIPIEKIKYKTVSAKGESIIQFYINNKFILFCFFINSKKFKNYIQCIYEISNNNDFSLNEFGEFNINTQITIKKNLISGNKENKGDRYN